LAVFLVIFTYFTWGVLGLYFKSLSSVSPLEILSHRIFWSFILLTIIITFKHKWNEIIPILCSVRKLRIYAASAILISVNWGIYIYSVVSGQALEASMGYFIMPLVAVMLGGIFFAEQFTKSQTIAIMLALTGVAYQIWDFGKLPWIALSLALSFGVYGMLRKKAPADSISGLFIETLLLSPLALSYMIYSASQGDLAFLNSTTHIQTLLILAGPITALPLIMFAFAVRNLRYSTVGLMQYINPTCQFLVAIFIFNETFQITNLITFGFIWAGLLLYTQNILMHRAHKKI
jgi:chloramphenicol-sensitive protein RarD